MCAWLDGPLFRQSALYLGNDADWLPIISGDVQGKAIGLERLVTDPVQADQMLDDKDIMVDHILIDLIVPFSSGQTRGIDTDDPDPSINQKIQQVTRQFWMVSILFLASELVPARPENNKIMFLNDDGWIDVGKLDAPVRNGRDIDEHTAAEKSFRADHLARVEDVKMVMIPFSGGNAAIGRVKSINIGYLKKKTAAGDPAMPATVRSAWLQLCPA